MTNPLLWTLAFGALATLLAVSGPLTFVRQILRKWGIWLLLAACIWLTWNLFAKADLGALWAQAGDGSLPFAVGFDIAIAMPLSWLPLIGDYSRFGKRAKNVFGGTAIPLLLILLDESENAFADIHSVAVSSGILLRLKVEHLALAIGVICTLIACFAPLAEYQNFLLLIGSVFAPLLPIFKRMMVVNSPRLYCLSSPIRLIV